MSYEMKPAMLNSLAIITSPSPEYYDATRRRKLEDALDNIGANAWIRITARRIFKKSGLEYAMNSIRGWEVA